MGEIYDATIGEITGSNRAADAAGRAAQAKEAGLGVATGYAQDSLTDAQSRAGQTGRDINSAISAANSPQELLALEGSMANQERFLVKQEQMMANIDPALMEASEQVLSILQGGESQFLDPIRKDREAQKKLLVDKLREQMGPGAETSTAGTQAINQFDQQSNMLLNKQRQGTLGQLFGIANTGMNTNSVLNARGVQGMGAIASGFGNRAGRMSQAGLNGAGMGIQSAGMVQGAFGQLIGAQTNAAGGAGSEFVSDQLKGQSQNTFMNDAVGLGAFALSGGFS